jgi:hypothetical protein
MASIGVMSGQGGKKCVIDKVLTLVEFSRNFMDPNLVGSKVKIVGMGKSQHDRLFSAHNVCDTALLPKGSYVCFHNMKFAWHDGEEEDAVEVFHIKDGVKTCKVGGIHSGDHVLLLGKRILATDHDISREPSLKTTVACSTFGVNHGSGRMKL